MGKELNRITYSEDEKIAAYIQYQLEGHNASAVERILHIPATTVRKWVKEWDATGFIPGEAAYVDKTVSGFIGKATKIRDMALEQMEKEVKNTKNMSQLIAVVDKLDNKIRIASGQATSIVEERKVDANELTAALARYIDSAANATIDRHNVVADVNFEEQVLGIPANTPDKKE